MLKNERVWVRGAGELGSGVVHLLHRMGIQVLLSDISPSLAIRRPVTFSDALSEGTTEVEGVQAVRHESYEFDFDTSEPHIPIFEDDPDKLLALKPTVIVDARMLKHYPQDYQPWTTLYIGLGPGFHVGVNCHCAIETKRGHSLGRILTSGAPLEDTGVPGRLGGETARRLVRATRSGYIKWNCNFGDVITRGQELARINGDKPVFAPIDGIIRGMISEAVQVLKGMKIGDIDPRGSEVAFTQISEKARMIASGVFEALILNHKQKLF